MDHGSRPAYARIIVDAPLPPLDYLVPADMTLVPGDRVVVPLGARRLVGLVVEVNDASTLPARRLRPVLAALRHTDRLSQHWLDFLRFTAEYYQTGWGEAALPALPSFWRSVPGARYEGVLKILRERPGRPAREAPAPELNPDQAAAVAAITASEGFSPFLLFGVTGSGKTEVYLRAMAEALRRDPEAQVLLLVPEINLTPQLEDRVRSRLTGELVTTMHSGLTGRDRAASWLAVHEGRSRVLVGTRMAIFASFRRLALIVVDEEHDASYKSGEGVRYSARDLAVKRAQMLAIPCLLGSATPALETWARAQSGAYRLLRLGRRANVAARMPTLNLIDTRGTPPELLTAPLRQAIEETLARREQVLIFINRRGYAPVVTCWSCGWTASCEHCSCYTVFHKSEGRMICHHCGHTYPVPRSCPCCGSVDLAATGVGTQKVAEAVAELWPEARLLRIDRDSTRGRQEGERAFAKVHRREVDIVIGTQMIAKGHDFQHVSLVAVLNVDSQLVSPDPRAEERLFATMMQVSGRAGRAGNEGVVAVQTRFPDHPVFSELADQDYEAFASRLLTERRHAHAPPFVYQAILRAQAASLPVAMGFLTTAAELAQGMGGPAVRVYDPVPMSLVKLMDVERAQLLVEADSRAELLLFLRRWRPELETIARPTTRWQLEVDPQEI